VVFRLKEQTARVDPECMKRPLLTAAAAALAALTAACGTPAEADDSSAAATAPEGPTLVIGSVSDDPKEEAEVFQPFADHLAAELADEGIVAGEVVVAETAEEMAELMAAGEVDLFVDSMYGITSVVEAGAAVPVLRRWKDGAPTYHSVVVARADSGLATAEQLRGRTIAFEEETSTDGYFLPVSTLREQGLTLTELPRPNADVPPGEAGYVFSGDDENTIFSVLTGRVAAGAVSAEDLEELAGDRLGELRVIARTIDVPRHGVVASKRLDGELRSAIVDTLTGLERSRAGREALEGFDETARFDELGNDRLVPVLRLFEKLGADR
jgi:phosphonate transport system substrate-binding protein